MANPEHLVELQKGVERWNRWRAEHPEIQPDLSGADLSNLDLSNVDFRKANLSAANLKSTNLAGANIADADLSGAQLQYALLKWADSRGTVFQDAQFTRDPKLSLHLETSLVARGAIAVDINLE